MGSLRPLGSKILDFNNFGYIIVFTLFCLLSCHQSRHEWTTLFAVMISFFPALFYTAILGLIPLVLIICEVCLSTILCCHDSIRYLVDLWFEGVIHLLSFLLLLYFSLSFFDSPLLPLLDLLKSLVEGQSLVFG